MPDKLNIAVLGAGSWGTTLAILLDENEHKVSPVGVLQKASGSVKDARGKQAVSPRSGDPEIDTDRDRYCRSHLMVRISCCFVVPSHATRDTARLAAQTGAITKNTIVVNASKGLEEKTLERMSEVLADELPINASQITTLSGPSHAEEVSQNMPTSVVAAGIDADTARRVQDVFFRPYFRVYTNSDLVGVEIGVALKNIIAIAAGVCDGLGYGDNTKAALLTRGLVEITRLGCALGAKQETFFGLAGIGDLIATSVESAQPQSACGRENRER